MSCLFEILCNSKCSLLEFEDIKAGVGFQEIIKSQDHRLVKFQPNCTNNFGIGVF